MIVKKFFIMLLFGGLSAVIFMVMAPFVPILDIGQRKGAIWPHRATIFDIIDGYFVIFILGIIWAMIFGSICMIIFSTIFKRMRWRYVVAAIMCTTVPIFMGRFDYHDYVTRIFWYKFPYNAIKFLIIIGYSAVWGYIFTRISEKLENTAKN